jgi:hypothetical protein
MSHELEQGILVSMLTFTAIDLLSCMTNESVFTRGSHMWRFMFDASDSHSTGYRHH